MVNEKETPSPNMPSWPSQNRYGEPSPRERLGRHKNLNPHAFLPLQRRAGRQSTTWSKKIDSGL
jgi:hypothetical protein